MTDRTAESMNQDLTEASRDALNRARLRRGDLRAAIEGLRRVLGADPEDEWLTGVREGLLELGDAIEEHIADIEGSEGLYTDILVQAPWQGTETETLRAEHEAIQESFRVAFEALEAAREGGLDDPGSVRRRIEALLDLVVVHSRREADLAFEVYDTDIGLID